ncbi:MAG: hypothetical protein ACQEP4_03945 [Bacillota bacterium]
MELKYLVKKAKKGEKEALLKLILQEKDNYYRLAYVYMKNQQDGVMLDGNGMVLFYTIEDTTKSSDIDKVHVRVLPKAPFMNGDSSGAGEIIEEEHIQKWVFTTDEAPLFFVRTVTLELSYVKDDGNWE